MKIFDLKTFLIANLRRISYKHPSRSEALKRARIRRGVYKCEECEGLFTRKELHIHHKDAVIDPAVGFVDWNTFISRLFVNADGLAVICKECHKMHTFLENEIRKQHKKENPEDI